MALAIVVTLPLLAPGFVLVYDMVFVPRPPITRSLLGLSRALPRSVPSGLLVALASRVLTGQAVQKIVLVGMFGLAAYGAARLVPVERKAARVAAGVLYAWNPLTYERLLLGQWALLLGYALLPWVVAGAVAVRRGEEGAWRRLVLALAAAMAAGPYTGIIGAVTALAVLGWPPWPESGRRMARWVLAGGAAAAVINLPWVLPGLLHASVPEDPSLALRLFRARSDSPVGLMGSLVSLGGVWRTDLAPPGRGTWAWVPAFLILAGVAVSGWLILRRRWPIGAVAGLVGVGFVGLVVAAAPGLPGLDAAARWAARTIPGGGVLRDSQKFVIPLALAWAVGFGTGVDAILARMPRGDRLAVAAAVALPVLPVALAPSLAWGAGGRLAPAAYPPSWSAVKEVVDQDPVPGAMAVLPWHAYLPFAWDDGRTVRQPALAYFSRPVVASSSLEVGGSALPDEDPWAALVRPEALAPRPLGPSMSRLGLRYVLLFKEADWRGSTRQVAGLDLILQTGDLALYRAPPPAKVPRFETPPFAPVVVGDLAALGLVLVAALGWRRRRGSARPRQKDGPTRGPPDMLRPLAEASTEET